MNSDPQLSSSPTAPSLRDGRSLGIDRLATALAIAIIVAGIVPRWAMIDRFYLDFDESMHFQAAKESTLVDTYWASRAYTHPPLVFLLYHLWLPFGESELMLRLPALVLGVAGLWVGYIWLRQMTDPWSALAGLMLLTFSLPMIHIAIQMRGYTLLLLLIFGGLYLREQSLRAGSIPLLIAATVCFTLAMLAHYATAWVLLTLGILTLVRFADGGVRRAYVASWAGTQIVLAAIAVGLLLDHALSFQGTRTQQELWANWLMDVPFQPGRLYAFKATIWKLLRLLDFIAARWWPLLFVVLIAGIISLYRSARRTHLSTWRAAEQCGLVVLPLILAAALFALKIYPLGATRHNLWLMPFLVLGVAAGVRPLFAGRARWLGAGALLALAIWTVDVPVREITRVNNQDTPEKLHQFAQLVRDTIPQGELLLVDDSTRNVLDYYLARDSVNHGRDLGHGFRQYDLAGYRVVALPDFHFYYANFSGKSATLAELLGNHAAHPLWIVYLGYDLPEMQLRALATRLPPGRMLERHSLPELDNQLLRVQLTGPSPTAETAQQASAVEAESVQEDGT
jgi:hypothetical protein